ncbi:conjugal transfer protein [Pseudomonas aeruginosa]|uniref:PFGI-1 class ICE element type IV pilus protein PilL2 n=1 Tax=Pseudomonas aeruginosa TaxID=287 RepID=UPI000BB8D386|nr:PilL N-terminal domain-containing protein [Pseudomonas aeruginosa]MBP8440879.1 PilL N-terminal domain-containing protein [Pseudomonas aeruginosa]MBP8446945.1 PilL N-terminal domain-containing protein [Pseudomonas aeruginosa]MBP8470756.1 PilL N-terminal domain-containing protein [Pseudomonas aeruginosa]MBP8482337.1 PilL N-terminal domain-containing protein [Pseudomonas aeruginosa]MBP8527546.1 PilL N-terminal domain-containing protein [Pseudomonas aeruginosa]
MCPSHPLFRHSGRGPLLGPLGLLWSLLASGCATTPPPPAPPEPPAAVAPALSAEFVPVVRYGRYTLVELVPDRTQRDLIQQVVDISIPSAFDATVGDALRYVLLRSGYRLCDTPDAGTLFALPLPAAHLHLGPLPLRDALLTLAGSDAWNLSIDDATRQVCFNRRTAPPPATAIPAAAPAESGTDSVDALQPWEALP